MKIRPYTMKEREVIRYLLDDFYAYQKLIALNSLIVENERILSMSAICKGEKNKAADDINRLSSLASEAVQNLTKIRLDVYDKIYSIPDPEQRAVLSMKYLSHMSFDEIVEALPYQSKATIIRRHLSGLEYLANHWNE